MQKRNFVHPLFVGLFTFLWIALPHSSLRAQSLEELIVALPEGTIPFLDVEARESLLKAEPTQEVEVQALGALLVLKVEDRTKRFLSFGTGVLSFEMVALPHSGGDILCCIATIKEPFVYSSISFFNKRGETLPPESFLPSCPITDLLLPEASDQDRAKVFGLSRYIFFSSSEEILNVSLVPESAPTEEKKEHWRTLLRPEPLRLKWRRKAFQLK
ncbi:DUF3256 family protein [Porphyromonas endodontalis]|uniref:DUF3256 domain-containing protein n=1 Tax=Porphyromonas endodontalis (strain ATCC 35406 / DSM 24491 / JCM 8526 / CCUG 16442 / BCRC 14492 / NCTC 13058 / HG 370) TaxID=553175 RepID=C3J7P8_POREA|nr:DUF3256 family protein [Porphyromonas endodontalis]EEN83644.1 hypothetical protein POREN0001_1137 [Porphyromonas endodontalis ATCC 35406]UBH65296.1 DUF3256 family protein [Porphyromonas endodontalis]SUB68085.1 Protein of uncharacterised function (DUF3256) [Porphyromonas endodontalis]